MAETEKLVTKAQRIAEQASKTEERSEAAKTDERTSELAMQAAGRHEEAAELLQQAAEAERAKAAEVVAGVAAVSSTPVAAEVVGMENLPITTKSWGGHNVYVVTIDGREFFNYGEAVDWIRTVHGVNATNVLTNQARPADEDGKTYLPVFDDWKNIIGYREVK